MDKSHSPDDPPETSQPEIDDLKRDIGHLENLISQCTDSEETMAREDEREVEDLVRPDANDPFAPRSTGTEQLPDQLSDQPGPYEQLGTTQEGRTVRGPRVRNAKSRKRRSGVKTIRSDWADVRRAKLSSLSQAEPGAVPDNEPIESRKNRIEFEEARTEVEATGGREMARATLVARGISALIFVLVLGGVVALALNARDGIEESDESNQLVALAKEIDGVVRGADSAKSVITNFWNASDIQSKLAYIWQAERIAPLMEAYYKNHILPTDRNFGSVRIHSSRAQHRHSEVPPRYVVASVDDHVGVVHDIILRPEGSSYLVDWEASVGYNPNQLSKLINFRQEDPVTLRVLITPAAYHNYQYSDQRVYQSFAIKVSDNDQPRCYAFAKRDSEVAKQLMRFFANRAQRSVAVTLQMRFPEEGDSGAELLALVRSHWITQEP